MLCSAAVTKASLVVSRQKGYGPIFFGAAGIRFRVDHRPKGRGSLLLHGMTVDMYHNDFGWGLSFSCSTRIMRFLRQSAYFLSAPAFTIDSSPALAQDPASISVQNVCLTQQFKMTVTAVHAMIHTPVVPPVAH